MTLTRDNVTAASRVMLPAYVLLFAYLGTNYALLVEGRVAKSPSLSYVDGLMPLPAWGGVFLAVAGILAAALLSRHRDAARYALWLGVVCMGGWALLFAAAAYWNDAPTSTCAWPAFVATACFASNRSLRRGETGGRGHG